MRKMLNSEGTHPKIKNEVGKYQSDVVQEVAKSVAENSVVVVGMKYNPLVNRARELLKNRDRFHLFRLLQLYIAVSCTFSLKNVDGLAHFPNGVC